MNKKDTGTTTTEVVNNKVTATNASKNKIFIIPLLLKLILLN